MIRQLIDLAKRRLFGRIPEPARVVWNIDNLPLVPTGITFSNAGNTGNVAVLEVPAQNSSIIKYKILDCNGRTVNEAEKLFRQLVTLDNTKAVIDEIRHARAVERASSKIAHEGQHFPPLALSQNLLITGARGSGLTTMALCAAASLATNRLLPTALVSIVDAKEFFGDQHSSLDRINVFFDLNSGHAIVLDNLDHLSADAIEVIGGYISDAKRNGTIVIGTARTGDVIKRIKDFTSSLDDLFSYQAFIPAFDKDTLAAVSKNMFQRAGLIIGLGVIEETTKQLLAAAADFGDNFNNGHAIETMISHIIRRRSRNTSLITTKQINLAYQEMLQPYNAARRLEMISELTIKPEDVPRYDPRTKSFSYSALRAVGGGVRLD